MKSAIYGENNRKDLCFLPGWGNRIGDRNMGWLTDLLVDDGFKVHVFEFPCNLKDFKSDYLAPVREYQEKLGRHVILSHSLGGLVAAYCSGQSKTVFLSPWWGVFGNKLRGTTLSIACRFKSGVHVLPIDFTKDEVGDMATDTYWAELPKKVSPSFIREIVKAQKTMPPLPENHVVFCSLRDTIVDLKAIGERTNNVILYDGFHELYSSSTRELYRDELLNALKE